MLATLTRTAPPPTTPRLPEPVAALAEALGPRPNALELEALIDAIDERLDTCAPDLIDVLHAGRRRLELELADLLGGR